MSFKPLYGRAREEGAEWYQIFLAEKLTGEAEGGRELFFFLLHLFKENESGHLRIELDGEGRELLDKYRSYFSSPQSPFVITGEDRFLYTRRRKAQEDLFVSRLEDLLARDAPALIDDLEGRIDTASEGADPPLPVGVRDACLRINREPFFIITGGPGTGKTTSLAGIIHSFGRAAALAGRPPLNIALAAPTGRAAKRMEQSLGGLGIAEPARTLHKLLRIGYDTGEPVYNGKNPLPADLVVVDEASMIDLRMMSLLFDALPPQGHLLLVGDKDQLPSVEAGAVFSDFLFGAEQPGHRLRGNILMLKEVFRSNREIINLAGCVIEGRQGDALDILETSTEGEAIGFHPLPEKAEPLFRRMADFYRDGLPDRGFREKVARWETRRESIDKWFSTYQDRIVLCPSRKGLMGVERLNREIRDRLFAHSLHGIPLMINSNDYDLDLYNGDRGVIFLFAGEPHVFFEEMGGYRHIPLTYLEQWDYSWVQTIHKSQGSEFREVAIILPPQAERMLSREILYTALTRARDRVSLYSQKAMVENCLAQGVLRNSRIKEVLSADPSPV